MSFVAFWLRHGALRCFSFDFVPGMLFFFALLFASSMHVCHSLFSKMFLLQVLAAPHELERGRCARQVVKLHVLS